MRTKLEVMEELGRRETVEDILITLDSRYHLIRPISGTGEEKLFFHLVPNRAQANLAMARRDPRVAEQQFHMRAPGAGRRRTAVPVIR